MDLWDDMLGKPRKGRESVVAADDAQELADRVPDLVGAASGASWYTEPGNPVDVAAVALCMMRRAASGDRASIAGGDAGVREILGEVQTWNPEALVWLVSRLISYLDDQGFPELVEPWMARDTQPPAWTSIWRQELADRVPELTAAASGASWYTEPGNPVDIAVVALCMTRRAASGDGASIEAGDAGVREVLGEIEPEALVWLVSRLISYMDEQGFPELVEPWIARDSQA